MNFFNAMHPPSIAAAKQKQKSQIWQILRQKRKKKKFDSLFKIVWQSFQFDAVGILTDISDNIYMLL